MPRTGVRSPISSFSMVDFPAPFSPTYKKKHENFRVYMYRTQKERKGELDLGSPNDSFN